MVFLKEFLKNLEKTNNKKFHVITKVAKYINRIILYIILIVLIIINYFELVFINK